MPKSQPTPTGPPRFIGAVFGFVFGGIGLTVLAFLWKASGFHEPPLFFKLFGSFIAIAFVAMGGALFFSAFRSQPAPIDASPADQPRSAPGGGYACPACGARLGEDADVSPKGDVKCGYCHKWFNIHG